MVAYGKAYSYNTAVVSMINYGERLTSYRASMVLTHEFGHSFGSTHDSKSDSNCVSNIYGNYIMYPYASDGSRPNENKFSQCSINTMYPVILNKGLCFADRSTPLCGNGIIEAGEECDCGTSFSCAYTDACCTPADVTNSFDAPCTIRRSEGYVCSPKTGICCEKDCTITPIYAGKVCGVASECQETVGCDGKGSNCPTPVPKPDFTFCDSDRKFCFTGKCIKSMCELFNLVECQCTSNYEDTCTLCCKPFNTTDCKTASSFGILSATGNILRLASGAPCNDFEGVCNLRHTCISGDTKDVIKRLKKVFSSYAGKMIRNWFVNNWYYVFFGLLLMILLIIVFFGCRGEHENVQDLAYRQGRFEQVMAQARIEKERQEKKMSVLAAMYDKKIRKARNGHQNLEYTYALVRLSVFFPTATKEVIQETLYRCSNEEVAVRSLLIHGYPMRRMIYDSYND
jgi:disintegrin and metalloproteinase domain-containing protein 10